ncbi:MAG TPA: hypothetical protein VGG19_09780 [Tepidisphaeraceae bacterium]|jgi:hypothetical protein
MTFFASSLRKQVGLRASVPLWFILFSSITLLVSPSPAQERQPIERGLAFLSRSQNTDGSFGTARDFNQRIITTSTVLLAFVSDGNAPDLGRFGSCVRATTDFLLRSSDEKMSSNAKQTLLTALGPVAGIDDNQIDQARISQLSSGNLSDTQIIPFHGDLRSALKTWIHFSSGSEASISYSSLYRAALFASDAHLSELTEKINASILSHQQRDGSWEGQTESTAFALLALTAPQHLMPINGH